MSLIPFVKHSNPYLKIVAPPNSFTMDIMEVSSYSVVKSDDPFSTENNTINANIHNKGYKYALIFIETTSRKVFGYLLKNKESQTVYKEFKKFLSDTGYRVENLTMDSGNEYNDIIKSKEVEENCIKIHRVVAARNMHTTLSRVDRVIRTLRSLIFVYFKKTGKYNWGKIFPYIIEIYNTTKHSSLVLDGVKYTPNQIWSSPLLSNKIRRKDTLSNNKSKRYLEDKMQNGESFNYLINNTSMSKGSKKGMISNDVVRIVQRIGNSFKVSSNNPKLDGQIIPYRSLIPITKNRSKYLNKIDFSKFIEEEERSRVKRRPNKQREIDRLKTNYLFSKDDKRRTTELVTGKRKSKLRK